MPTRPEPGPSRRRRGSRRLGLGQSRRMPCGPPRCGWVPEARPLFVAYHDDEWGVPEHDGRKLFKLLTLEGAQAGLAWITILRKREGYRRAFSGFDPRTVAAYDERRVEELLGDPG